MFAIINICLILFIGEINCLFVEVGPDTVVHHGHPECGLRREGRIVQISLNKKCFLKQFPNFTIFIERPINKVQGRVLPQASQSDFGGAQSRMFKGRDALITEAPWTVRIDIHFEILQPLIQKRVRKYETCTGALLTLEWVVTAAHCFSNFGDETKQLNRIFVYAGSSSAQWGTVGSLVLLDKHIDNPEYKTGSFPDANIALLKVNEKFSHRVENGFYTLNPICLPKLKKGRNATYPIDYGNTNWEEAHFTGFGRREFDKQDNLGTLQWKTFRLMPWSNCHHDPDKRSFRSLCSNYSSGETKTCVGDDGGPLFQFSNDVPSRAIHIGVLGLQEKICSAYNGMHIWFPTMSGLQWIVNTIASN